MIKITDKSQCCGCNACVNACPVGCIGVRTDDEGFAYPLADDTVCVDCDLCQKVCPMINQSPARLPLQVFAAINEDQQVRSASSSGGVFTLLATNVLEDGGVVFGAAFDDEWNVVHRECTDIEGLEALRGSKYSQSDTGDSYRSVKRYLDEGRMVLFSGTPCQISGLKKYLGKDYDRLLTVDVVCHGVPSPLLWKCYLDSLSRRAGECPVAVSFRDKSTGWKSYSFNVTFPFVPPFSQKYTENVFFKYFLSDVSLRPSCYNCNSKAGRSASDITLGDWWGIHKVHPEMDDDRGVSLVMLNTEKGRMAFDRISCGKVETIYDDAVISNPSVIKSAKRPFLRNFRLKSVIAAFRASDK